MSSNKLDGRRSFFAGRRPRVMAHRGASGITPENTLLSFQAARDQGADVLETDVRMTADKRVICIHDPTLERTTNGVGAVSDKILSEIRELDAGYNFTMDGGKTFPFRGKGATIPTLDELLAAFPDMPFNVEIKDDDIQLVHRVMSSLERHGRLSKGDVLITGARHSLVEDIRVAAPSGITGHSRREIWRFLFSAWFGIKSLFRPDGDAIQIPARKGLVRVATRQVVNAAHALGLEVHVWTVDDPDEIVRLLKLGVDGIFTNHPGRMRQIVDMGLWKQ